METSIVNQQIEKLEQEIANLPAGSIGKKNVRGKEYFYHRWMENGKLREKSIPSEELEGLKEKIQHRKELEKELRELKKSLPRKKKLSTTFKTNIRVNEMLRSFASPTKNFHQRDCYRILSNFLYGERQDKVLILYGLRRTGKTTMIRQAIAGMDDDAIKKAAFIQIGSQNTLSDVNHDLKILEKQGYRYVFLDEVTLMEDFIEGAALFSDIFAASGMKIVLSGTDSLGFLFTEDEQLYDRCIMLHTTFIPYHEFESVLGIHGIDEYIRYGGTMSIGGIHYNESSTFASKKSTDEYIDTAIAQNIQHSLRCYQYGGHFRHLQELYEKDELTSVINRVVEDINHRFTLDVLTKDWKSNDLGISASNLRRDRTNPTTILDEIDIASVTETIRKQLEIKNKEEQSVKIEAVHAAEIKEYLDLLDLTNDIDVLHLPNVGQKSSRTVISQPGLRYAQASALINALLLDETFAALSLKERMYVQERILTEIRGRMLEDIVLLETKLANPKKQVFVLQFPVGEFDMVVFDPETASCQIFEIKHSKEIIPQQYRHLVDEQKCSQTEHRYGTITGKFVLYRGETKNVNDIQYWNVEEYLRNCWKTD